MIDNSNFTINEDNFFENKSLIEIKRKLPNLLFKQFDSQAKTVLEILNNEINLIKNKSIILYLSFLYAELKIKALYAEYYDINELNAVVDDLHICNSVDDFSIGRVGHKIGNMYKQISSNYKMMEINDFSSIIKYLDKLDKADLCCKTFISDFNKNNNSKSYYTCLRYNLTKDGEIVITSNEITDDFLKIVKEALDYAF